METVSIIVPVYNVEPYLVQCLDSIASQSYRNLEVILVDDGSPDGCGLICDEYAAKDSRFSVIHQKNSGVSKARNAALEKVTGKYLTFCDSDDRYAPNWIQCLVTAMEKDTADMVLGGHVHVVDMEESKTICHEAGVFDCRTMNQKIEYCVNRIMNHDHGWEIWARLFQSDIVKNNDIRFCETCQNFAEDLGFTLEYILCATRVTVIREAGYLYTIRSGSMMQSSVGKVKLNSTNEVALSVLQRMQSCFGKAEIKKFLPVFHYLIMQNQYQVIIACGQYRSISEHIKQIKNYDQWKYWTWLVLGCRRELKALLGKRSMQWVMLYTAYHLSGNWPVFALGNELLERAEQRSK